MSLRTAVATSLRRVVECRINSWLKGAKVSTTAHLVSSRNRPKNSGDKGPEKNYVKNVMKKANKNSDTEGTARAAFMEALKATESGEHLPQDKQAQEDKLDSLVKMEKGGGGQSRRWRPRVNENWDKIGGNRMSEKDKEPIHFANPESGPRLGIFSRLGIDANVMPSGRPSLAEQEKWKQLENIQLLQTSSYFEDRLKVPYPRQFPIDNENYEHEESGVSFKDHVLLDHLIRDFPSKGPVRHFMELVVTGLSMNPDYTVTEKQDVIKWYRDYFAQFTYEELQALSTESLPSVDAAKTGSS